MLLGSGGGGGPGGEGALLGTVHTLVCWCTSQNTRQTDESTMLKRYPFYSGADHYLTRGENRRIKITATTEQDIGQKYPRSQTEIENMVLITVHQRRFSCWTYSALIIKG